MTSLNKILFLTIIASLVCQVRAEVQFAVFDNQGRAMQGISKDLKKGMTNQKVYALLAPHLDTTEEKLTIIFPNPRETVPHDNAVIEYEKFVQAPMVYLKFDGLAPEWMQLFHDEDQSNEVSLEE